MGFLGAHGHQDEANNVYGNWRGGATWDAGPADTWEREEPDAESQPEAWQAVNPGSTPISALRFIRADVKLTSKRIVQKNSRWFSTFPFSPIVSYFNKWLMLVDKHIFQSGGSTTKQFIIERVVFRMYRELLWLLCVLQFACRVF